MDKIVNELTDNNKPGDQVSWTTLGGKTHVGILQEYDNGTAIVRVNDKDVAVRTR